MILQGLHRGILAVAASVLVVGAATAQAPPRPQPTCVEHVTLGLGEDASKATLLLREGRIAAILEPDAPVPPGMHVIEGEGLVCLPTFIDGFTHTGVETPAPDPDQDVPVDTTADVRIDMRLANRKGIEPAFRAAEAFAFDQKDAEAWREAGFGVALVSPGGQLLSGTSVLATTREAAARDLVVEPDVFAHAAFATNAGGDQQAEGGRRRRGGSGYPSTLMGYIAQLRQFFLDSKWHAELERRQEQGRPGLRPPFDAELEAGVALIGGKKRLVCEAETHRDILRWIKLADEFGLWISISGGRDAWRVADVLAARDIPVFLTLDWGKEVKDPLAKAEKKGKKEKEGRKREKGEEVEAVEETPPGAEPQEEAPEESPEEAQEEVEEAPEAPQAEESAEEPAEEETVWDYEEPLGVRLERRKEWEEKRDCAIRLHEAGVRFAFGTAGEKPKKLLENVRTLIEAGLPADAALAGLTTDAAALLGEAGRLGKIAPGFDATFTLWSGDPLTDAKAKARWAFVDGFPSEFEKPAEKKKEGSNGGGAPAEGLDVSGTWALEVSGDEGTRTSTMTLTMAPDGSIEGSISQENPRDQSLMEADVTGKLSGKELELSYTFTMGEFSLDVTLQGTVEGDELDGTATFSTPWSQEPMTRDVKGKREPQNHSR